MGDIVTTKWTPELIPVELPDNIDPELVEPYYKKNGEVIRTTANRKHEAVCLNPKCPLAWQGATAFPEATAHTSNTGHLTRLYYTAEYTMQVNPLHPKIAGRIATSLLAPDDADISPYAAPVLGQPPLGRTPTPSGRKQDRIQRRMRSREKTEALQEVIAINEQQEREQASQSLD